MLTDLIIYLPFIILALADFAFFSRSSSKVDDEPTFWKNRRRGYDIDLAARREDAGYSAG